MPSATCIPKFLQIKTCLSPVTLKLRVMCDPFSLEQLNWWLGSWANLNETNRMAAYIWNNSTSNILNKWIFSVHLFGLLNSFHCQLISARRRFCLFCFGFSGAKGEHCLLLLLLSWFFKLSMMITHHTLHRLELFSLQSLYVQQTLCGPETISSLQCLWK